MRLVAHLARIELDGTRLAFSGGTSLSKGYGLIQRFSEDLDFKVLLPKGNIARAARRAYRDAFVSAIRGAGQWALPETNITVGNESRFFRCDIQYPVLFDLAPALRPNIKLEVSFVSPALPVETRSLRSFVAQARQEEPEVPSIACIVPAETAADKLSALTWRVLARSRSDEKDDPTLVRHLYDLAALESHAARDGRFPTLLGELLVADANRGRPSPEILAMSPTQRLMAALETLASDSEYPAEYERYVRAMSYADDGRTPSFDVALAAARRLAAFVS